MPVTPAIVLRIIGSTVEPVLYTDTGIAEASPCPPPGRTTQPTTIPLGAIASFLVITFGVAWGILAALIVVFRLSGIEGLRRYLGRFLIWHYSWRWYIFLLFGVPMVFLADSVLKGNISEAAFPFASIHRFFGALILVAFNGPIEEFGWRGLALPLLQRKMAPIWADAQPYDSYLFAIVAVVLVGLNRKTMFTRKYSIKEVIPEERTISP